MADYQRGRYTPSPPPPPPPPKNDASSVITSATITSPGPSDLKSPVRRKPLPTKANVTNSPNSTQSQTNSSTEIFGQVVQHLTARQQTLESPPRIATAHYSNTDADSPTTHDNLPHISHEDFPVPPSTRASNDSVDNNVIAEDMALKPGTRPAPLRTESSSSQTAVDLKKPQTPGSKFTSFFTRKQTSSPVTESAPGESEPGRSPLPSPYPNSANSATGYFTRGPASQPSQDSIEFDPSQSLQYGGVGERATVLEAELREISKELAQSIKREMDLEDMVERYQAENPSIGIPADRTSDYFSDSGTSSIRPPTSEMSPKEELERLKRDMEQQRAQLKVDFSQKWQREVATRKAMESHLQYMEHKLKSQHVQRDESAGMSTKARELETSLDDTKRRLHEERQTNQNFEDLLGALREDLVQLRNERDNLRDEIVPSLKTRIEGLEAASADAQKAPYDVARMQHELQSLRDENAALHSARMMNAQFESIAEEDGSGSRRNSFISRGGIQRSATIGRSASRAGAGLSRSNSISKNLQNESRESLAEQIKAVEQQREALHTTVKYLLRRQSHDAKQTQKRLHFAEAERDKAMQMAINGSRKGYEKEVRVLRAEIGLLRRRADEAMEQKWQCEKGLASLAMDLDRSKQETASLQGLLDAKDSNDPEVLSSALEKALAQLNQQRSQVGLGDSLGSLANEEEMATELERSAERSEALASQVKQQLKNNSSLRTRLKDAIERGHQSQLASAAQITELQAKLRKLEDTITSAQTQSETAVLKHEEEMRLMRASNNVHLLRAKNSNPNLLSPTPRSPLSPMIANSKKSPRLEMTSSGPGIPLHEALKTEFLERKVAELEKALSEAEREMGEVVGRMNTAQISTAELEGERYDCAFPLSQSC
jgi:hypothetical protein